MKWTEIAGGPLNRTYITLLTAFGERADEVVLKINSNPGIADRVAALVLNNGYELSVSQAKARKIMDKNFFGLEETQKHFDFNFSKRQLAYMAEVPFPEETLCECKHTHVLVAYVPISIVVVRAKTATVKLPAKHRMFYQQDWYNDNVIGNYAGTLDWHLVRKNSVPNSKCKNWQDQESLLDSKVDEIPEANVMVYTIIGHFLNTGECLLERDYVRTCTLDSGGRRVNVGGFNSDGLSINTALDDLRRENFGLSSAKKRVS